MSSDRLHCAITIAGPAVVEVAASMVLSLTVLGEFAVRDEDGRELPVPGRKMRALLGYLAANADKPQRRERLMSLLWSDRAERQARHSLNQALTSIRNLGKTAGRPILESDGERVTLPSAAIDIDLVRFHGQRKSNSMEAIDLYQGSFLEGLAIPDPAFEEWVSAARAHFHGLACETFEQAANAMSRSGNTRRAIQVARRLVALDPLREDAHRCLIRLLFDSGDRAGALRQYNACSDILMRELRVAPDTATKTLFDQIRNSAAPSDASVSIASTVVRTPPSIPDIPSIAVLPFDNLGGDPAQDFFGDGIAEDIITELSRFRSLFVIARGSSFSFKEQSVDTRQIARELGVRYVLEGSVRAHGARIRINAQLIDATSGHHVWSERYDRETEDIFALQDEITRCIVGIIEPAIGIRERERARLQRSKQLDAWALFQSGLTYFYNSTREDLKKAERLFTRAIEIDPDFAAAHALQSDTIIRRWLYYNPADRTGLLSAALALAETAMRLDPQDARGPLALARVQSVLGNTNGALALVGRALNLNTNIADAYHTRGFCLLNNGASVDRVQELEQSIEEFDRAIRLSPNGPAFTAHMQLRARALLELKRFEEAAECAQIACRSPGARYWAFAFLTIALKQHGKDRASKAALDDLLRRFPDFHVGFAQQMQQWPAASRNYFETLLKAAGVPDKPVSTA